MIKIKRDKVEINVTKGAYENFYKSQGFEIVGEPVKEVEKEVIKDAVIVEKPKAFAKEANVEPPIEDNKEDFNAFILNELKAEKDIEEAKVEKVEKPKAKKGLK